jgi:hypothetical protein
MSRTQIAAPGATPAAYLSNKNLLRYAGVLIVCLSLLWVLYLSLGRGTIKSVYMSNTHGWLQELMPHRDTTTLESYYHRADELLVSLSAWTLLALAVVLILALAVRQPAGAFLVLCSLTVMSAAFFILLELFPQVIVRFGLDRIDYYAWKSCCVPDSTFRFRFRPLTDQMIPFRGYMYSPIYGVDTPLMMVHLTTDRNGFIHNNDAPEHPDIAVIGDSFIGDAVDEADTFGRRLQMRSDLKVANLGVAGYGPFQYVEILKRYAVQLRPRYAFFTFYAGNDLEDLRSYGEWMREGEYHTSYLLSRSLPRRYFAAMAGSGRFISHLLGAGNSLILQALSRSYTPAARIHPDIAVVKLGDKTYKMLLTAENKEDSTAKLIHSPEWSDFENLVSQFKSICLSNGITPVVLYIPTAAAMYAEHTTEESGERWLGLREVQIKRKAVTRDAVAGLARQLELPFLDLDIPFESAAQHGELLYYTFDTHWNPRGREIAAEYVANWLKTAGAD